MEVAEKEAENRKLNDGPRDDPGVTEPEPEFGRVPGGRAGRGSKVTVARLPFVAGKQSLKSNCFVDFTVVLFVCCGQFEHAGQGPGA